MGDSMMVPSLLPWMFEGHSIATKGRTGMGTIAFLEGLLTLVNDEVFEDGWITIEHGEMLDIKLCGLWLTGIYDAPTHRIVFSDQTFCVLVDDMTARAA